MQEDFRIVAAIEAPARKSAQIIVCFRQACVVEDTWFNSWGLCRDDERVRASG
jgi:hypothetical protein